MRSNWDDLRIFLAVARGDSLSGAGRVLRMDPATVGRRVARLEEAAGEAAHARSGRTAPRSCRRRPASVVAERWGSFFAVGNGEGAEEAGDKAEGGGPKDGAKNSTAKNGEGAEEEEGEGDGELHLGIFVRGGTMTKAARLIISPKGARARRPL